LRTLVIGLGNPIVTDDGAGIRVAQIIREKVHRPDVDIVEMNVGGFGLLERITGYDRLILIDTIRTPGGLPGSVLKLGPDMFGSTQHLSSPHDVGFKEVIELGRKLGLYVPREIAVYAVEAEDITTFGERCTPSVAKAVPRVADLIIDEQFDRSPHQPTRISGSERASA